MIEHKTENPKMKYVNLLRVTVFSTAIFAGCVGAKTALTIAGTHSLILDCMWSISFVAQIIIGFTYTQNLLQAMKNLDKS
jgi:hypothetical protein